MKVLVAIDGSECALHALQYIIEHRAFFSANPELVLVNVHLPLPSVRSKAVLGSEVIERYYADEAEAALAPARAMLAEKPCHSIERSLIGQPSALIIATAQQEGCDLIVMGTQGRSALGNLQMGSVATRVIATSPVPVLSVK